MFFSAQTSKLDIQLRNPDHSSIRVPTVNRTSKQKLKREKVDLSYRSAE